MTNPKLTPERLGRRAIVYVRQSTPGQVLNNLESQRRQYNLAERAREMGFQDVRTIDDDLGRSGGGQVDRPGFQQLVTEVCAGQVGAIFCIEASRLARNGRDWHHLIELCGLVGTIVIDPDGLYDPCITNDRLLLGLKGTMSEFELNLFRQRSMEAIRMKAGRGELRFCLPVGFCWSHDGKVEIDPDARVREAIDLVFRKMNELGSARQVLLWFIEEQLSLPSVVYDEFRTLKELCRSYLAISKDLARTMNRIKALYRSWSIPCGGTSVYAPHHRAEWLSKITEAGVRRRAELFYQQLDGLQELRQQARRDLLAESRKHGATNLLQRIPYIGPIRAALLIALLQTPHRFRRNDPRGPWRFAVSTRTTIMI